MVNLRPLFLLVGLALMAIVLWDAFETVVLPRTVTRRLRLARARRNPRIQVLTRRERLRLAEDHATRHRRFHDRPGAEVAIEGGDLERHQPAAIAEGDVEFGIAIHARACRCRPWLVPPRQASGL